MKTVKQIADEIGVPKQRVYRYIKRECISEAHQNAGVMYYDEAAESLIIQAFSNIDASGDSHQEAHQTASSEAVINVMVEMLKKELEIKNEQIQELNLRLAESNAALVGAQQTAQAAQALHAGTIQQQLIGGSSEPQEAPPTETIKKKSRFPFFQRAR